MIQITFTPGNSAQADLIGKLMAQYLSLAELDTEYQAKVAQAAETAAVEATPVPKATRARKPAPAAAVADAPASSTAETSAQTATTATSTTTQADPTPTATTAETEGNAAAAPSEPEAAAASTASSTAPAVTLEQVRAKLADLSKAGKTQQVVALIASMGAKKLTDVPAEKFGQLLAQAEAL